MLRTYIPLIRSDNVDAGREVVRILEQSLSSPEPGDGELGLDPEVETTFGLALLHPVISPDDGKRIDSTFKAYAMLAANMHNMRAKKMATSAKKAARDGVTAGSGGVSSMVGGSTGPHSYVVSAVPLRIYKPKDLREYEFVVEVTWNTGEITLCHRTHSAFYDFQVALLDKFPQDVVPGNRVVPYLPGKKLFANFSKQSKSEVAKMRFPGIRQCVSSLVFGYA
jgi:hypothetical protein